MAKFIVLTSANHGAMYVNVDKIEYVRSVIDGEQSYVFMQSGNWHLVNESVSEIINLITTQGCSS